MTESHGLRSVLGQLLESKRTNVLQISVREAARRAGVSEGTWRQVVKGRHASVRVVVAMALGVSADPAEALAAAGIPVDPEHVAELVDDVRRGSAPQEAGTNEERLVAEIERVSQLPISEGAKARIRVAIVDAYEKAAQEAKQDAEQERRSA